jgi:hypothetical protein
MEFARYDILRRGESSAIWLETSADLKTAKSRIKEIVSFWPGRYEVIEHHSQRIVASAASSTHVGVTLARMREYAHKSFLATYEWLLAPAPLLAGLATYTRMQKYARDGYRTSHAWLCAPVARVQAVRDTSVDSY